MANVIEDGLLRQLNTNPTAIERWIVLGAVRSLRFFRTIQTRVCPRTASGLLRQDFLTPRYNQLYAVIARYWDLFKSQSPLDDMEIPKQLLLTLLQDEEDLNRILPDELVLLRDEIERCFYAAQKVAPEFLVALRAPLSKWLGMRVTTMITNSMVLNGQSKILDMSILRATIDEFSKSLADGSDRVKTGASVVNSRIRMKSRLRTKLTDLDLALGFWGRGETTLIAGANGAGKTVLAGQIAVDFASQGLRVVYVTTEMTPLQMIHRMMSYYIRVPYDSFINRVELKHSNVQDELDIPAVPDFVFTDPGFSTQTQDFMTEVLPNVTFLDWSDGSNPVVQEQLESDMQEVINSQGRYPDVLIFDWIGGALDRGKDKDHLRHHYYDAVNFLVNFGKVHKDVVVVVMAQIDKVKADKQPCIKMIHMAECKAMSDNVATFVGISSMNDQGTDGIEMTRPIQTLFVDKARFGRKGGVRVMRRFDLQHFGQVGKAGSNSEPETN